MAVRTYEIGSPNVVPPYDPSDSVIARRSINTLEYSVLVYGLACD